MHDLLGDENMFLFGLRADEVEQLKREGYVPQRLYNRDPVLHRCLDALRTGFRDGVRYDDLYQRLLFGAGGSPADEYFLLADFQAYCQAEKRMAETYRDQTAWNRMSLHNIARSGVFAADRSGERVHLPVLPAEMVNTTGCGDAFMAAITWAYLAGTDLTGTAKAGLAASAIAMEGAETINPALSEDALLARAR